MVKVIYNKKLQSNKIPLALLAISTVISSYVSTASSSTSNELVTQQQVGAHTGSVSSSSDPVVPPTVGSHRDNAINITMCSNLNGNTLFSLPLPATATTYDLYRAAESQVNNGIGIILGGEQIPNYLYPTNATRLTDLGITNDTTLTCVLMEHSHYQVHPDDTALDEDSITTAINEMFNPMVMRRRLIQLRNTQEPIIHYSSSVEYSSDGENWCRLDNDTRIDTNMKLRYVGTRGYVVGTPAFVCDRDGLRYVGHLFINRFRPAESYCRTNSGHECRTINEYVENEDFGPFAELQSLFTNFFGYFGYNSCRGAVHNDSHGLRAPSQIYRVNTNDSNDLWNILSAYYISRQYTSAVVGLSPDHNQILRTLLQKIGITYDLEFHNLLLEECDGGGEFWCGNELKPGEAQWLRVAFRDRMEPCSAAGRIYIRNNVGGESVCFVTLHPLPVLMNA